MANADQHLRGDSTISRVEIMLLGAAIRILQIMMTVSMMYIRDEDIKTAFLRMIRKLQTVHAKSTKTFY